MGKDHTGEEEGKRKTVQLHGWRNIEKLGDVGRETQSCAL